MNSRNFGTIQPPSIDCPKCGFYAWFLARCRNQGGQTQHFFMCGTCEYRQTQYIKKKDVAASGLQPIEVQPKRPRHVCEKCGVDGAENHHWAPQSIFGAEANQWPTSYLCPQCHAYWHQKMTQQGRV